MSWNYTHRVLEYLHAITLKPMPSLLEDGYMTSAQLPFR